LFLISARVASEWTPWDEAWRAWAKKQKHNFDNRFQEPTKSSAYARVEKLVPHEQFVRNERKIDVWILVND